MELWIRTQKRDNLIKVDWLKMEEIPDRYGYKYYIYYRNERLLGIYKTKERALEILDEIQKLLQPQILCKKGKIAGSFDNTIYKEPDKIEIQELSVIVYEMPKE